MRARVRECEQGLCVHRACRGPSDCTRASEWVREREQQQDGIDSARAAETNSDHPSRVAVHRARPATTRQYPFGYFRVQVGARSWGPVGPGPPVISTAAATQNGGAPPSDWPGIDSGPRGAQRQMRLPSHSHSASGGFGFETCSGVVPVMTDRDRKSRRHRWIWISELNGTFRDR